MAEKCRHNKTLLVAGGHMEWCYECGAMRQMWVNPEGTGVYVLFRDGRRARWIMPAGKGGENPREKLV